MRRRRMVLAAAAILLVARVGTAQEKKPDEPVIPDEKTDLLTPEPLPKGDLVVIDDHWWTTLLSDEPLLKLKDAVERLKAGDAKTAALDIRKATAHTRVAMARSDAGIKRDIARSVEELDALARRIEKGEILPPDSLALPIARDLQALAAHHAEKATQHWAGGSGVKAGYDLKAAAMDLEAAAEWAGSDDLPQVKSLAAAAEQEADRLIEEKNTPQDLVASLLTQVQHSVQELRGILRQEGAPGK